MVKSCFLFGDSDAPDALFPALVREIDQEIERGVTAFYVERDGNFSAMAVRALQDVKRRRSGITAMMMPVYERPSENNPVPDGFDGTFFPYDKEYEEDPDYVQTALVSHMFIMSDSVVCYVLNPGWPMHLFDMAFKWYKDGFLRLENLWPFDEN